MGSSQDNVALLHPGDGELPFDDFFDAVLGLGFSHWSLFRICDGARCLHKLLRLHHGDFLPTNALNARNSSQLFWCIRKGSKYEILKKID